MNRIPGCLTESEARARVDVDELAAIERHCDEHQVTTCPTCNGLFQLCQLVKPAAGYYPTQLQPTDEPDGRTCSNTERGFPPSGKRYAFECPFDRTDLTALVKLHYEACCLTPNRR